MIAVLRPHFKGAARLVMLGCALMLAACGPTNFSGTNTGQQINTRAPVPVALLVPGGSANAGDALLAQSFENAARLAIGDLDGVEVDLKVYNTGGTAEGAAAMATRAVDEGAKIILGPIRGESANAAGLAVASRNVNVLSFSNNAAIAGGNVFILGNTFENTAQRLVSYATRQGRSNILVLHARNVAGETARAAVSTAAARSGARITDVETYDFNQTDIINSVPRIAGTIVATGSDAVFLTSDTAGALPLFAQLLPENGVNPAEIKYLGLARWDVPVSTLSLPGLQGGWFALPDPALTEQFGSRYSAAYGTPPHALAGLAYDGIAAIGALVKSGDSGALTSSALTQPSGFVGVNGVFRLLPDGTNQRALAVAEVRDSQRVVIDPAPRSFAAIGF